MPGATRDRAGFTLEEMMTIAAEAGLDPALVEEAARLLRESGSASRIDRLLGAPVRVRSMADFDVRMTPERADHLLSAIQAVAEQQGEGHATSAGLTWHSQGEGTQYLVTMHMTGDRARLRVVGDRGGDLAIGGIFSAMGCLATGIAIVAIGEASGAVTGPLIGLGLVGGGVGSVALGARYLWKASARGVRAKVDSILRAARESIESMDDDDAG